MRVLRSTVTILALSATVLTGLPAAHAGDWRGYRDYEAYSYRHNRPYQPAPRPARKRHKNDELLAAGVIGLAAGALVGGLIAQSRQDQNRRVYIDPPRPPVYSRPIPAETAYYGGMEPWSGEWYRYCSRRFRSFDPDSGTYLGYDGRRHFCQPR